MFKNIEELFELCKNRMLVFEKQLNNYVEMQIHDKKCPVCNSEMSIFTKFSFKTQYRCVRCQKKMTEFALKTNFKKCDIVTVINFIFYYSVGIAPSEISTLSDIPIHQIYKFLKNIQIAIYENDIRCHKRIGGPNLTVEIDESQVGKRKNNVGRIPNHK
ncbi:hypothetical protein H312_00505, partial [Anncaliia algerae PRA339]